MRLKLPRYVHGYADRHGKVRYYFRRAGFKRVPLPGLPWSPEFMAAYEASAAGKEFRSEVGAKRTAPGSVNAAVIAYFNSDPFRNFSPVTQATRRAILNKFRNEHGDKRIALILKVHLVGGVRLGNPIKGILSGKSPAAFRNWLKTLRGLFSFAVAAEMREDDPSAGIKAPKYKSTGGFHSWTEAEIAQFEDKHPAGSKARLAFTLLLYTAQRRGDVIRMGPQHVSGASMNVKQSKTGAELLIPIHRELASILAVTPKQHLNYITTEKGQPFTAAGFGNWFRDRCDEAGLSHCSAHGLRKAACRRLAEAGCTVKQIQAISGHRTLSEVQRYTDAADQAQLARSAMDTLQNAEEQPVANQKSGSPK